MCVIENESGCEQRFSRQLQAMDVPCSDLVLQDAQHIQFRAAAVIYVSHYRKHKGKG